jgi:hypothetical protein
MRLIAVVTLVCAGLPLVAAERGGDSPSASARKPTARVIGLQLADPAFDQGEFERAPLPAARGTVMRVLIEHARPIVSLDRRASAVSMFRDDTGRQLRPKRPNAADNESPQTTQKTEADRTHVRPTALRLSEGHPIDPGTEISRNGRRMVVSFRAPRLPDPEASELQLKARLNVRLGIEKETITLKDVPIRKGPIDIEGRSVAIHKRGESQWGEQPFYVQLQLEGQSAERFIKARILSSEGKDITARQRPPVWMAEAVRVPVSLKRQVDRATLELTFFKAVTTETLPIDVKTGLGLQ